MNKNALLLSLFLFLSGCSIYNTKMGVENIHAPDASTQLLRNTPLVASAKNAVFFKENNILKVKDQISKMKDTGDYVFSRVDGEIVFISAEKADSFIAHGSDIINSKIYVDIYGLQNYAGQIMSNLFKAGASTIMTEANVKYDTKRLELLKVLIEDELKDKGFSVTGSPEEAKYRMRVLVIEDGMTAKTTVGFLYMIKRKTGIVALEVDIISNETDKIVASYRTKNSSYLKSTSILYCIPIHSSSVNYDIEF